jgi:hypothetical protein
MRPRGIFAFPSREDVVGIALRVHRWSDGSALALGEGVMDEFGGRRISGGPLSNASGSGGDVRRLVL